LGHGSVATPPIGGPIVAEGWLRSKPPGRYSGRHALCVAITPSGTEGVLYTFEGGKQDGKEP
jgi:hypothetical protein